MKPTNPFARVFKLFDKVAIAGGPKTGKTTLSRLVTDRPVLHTDDHMSVDWSKQSENLAAMANAQEGKFVVEGMTVPRALRKGMKVDAVIWLGEPKVEQTKGQKSMGKAARTIFNEWHAANSGIPVYVEAQDIKDYDYEVRTIPYNPFDDLNDGGE